MAFDLDSYEPVAARLVRFLHDHPDGRIVTDLVHYLADTAVFKAELWLGDALVATGWAEEIRGQGNVNRTSHLENCESSAVGRALANYGYAGSDPSKRPSREEMTKVQRHGGSAQPVSSGGITPAQAGKIRAMLKGQGKLPPADLDAMTKAQASAMIEDLIANKEDPF